LFTAVRDVYPEDLNNAHALGLAYWHAGYPAAALKVLKEVHKANPAFEPARVSLKTVQALMAKSPRKHKR
jgi:hypothetical protein